MLIKSSSHTFCGRRVRIPLPLFILNIVILLALVALSVFFIFQSIEYKAKLHWQPPPMILLPGVTMSKLYVEGFNITYPEELAAINCPRDIPLRKSWLSPELADNPECETYLLQMDSEFKNMPNVRVTPSPPGVQFGSAVDSIQCIGSDSNPKMCDSYAQKGIGDSYFRPFVEFLMDRLKYQPGKTLFAAPYDWRHNQKSEVMEQYYTDLQFLVEHTFNLTNRRVLLLAHSMGNILINRFLRDKVTPEWQKQHLEATINVAAPYGGIPAMMQAMYAGGTMPFSRVSSDLAKKLARNMGFPANLLPYKNAFGNETLFSIKDDKYTADRIANFLAKVNTGNLGKFYAENEPQPQPHIPMHCIYSIGTNNTGYKYTYITDSEQSEQAQIEYGDGDKVVNAESLRVCQQWKRDGQPVEVKELANWAHSEILTKADFFAYITKVVTDVRE